MFKYHDIYASFMDRVVTLTQRCDGRHVAMLLVSDPDIA